MASNIERDRADERIEENETANCNMFVSNKKTKAFVRKYFGFEAKRNDRPLCVDLPKCQLCQATIVAKDFNTSNL